MVCERVCLVCGKTFTSKRRGHVTCSPKCNKIRWTRERSRKRELARGDLTRICAFCGNPFKRDPEHPNQRFCSEECRKSNERDERSVFKDRRDVIHVEAAAELNHALDSLRETKDDEYFKAVLALPREEQYAEMATWTVEDHAAFARHCGASSEDDEGDEDFFAKVETPRIESGEAFDEENHFE